MNTKWLVWSIQHGAWWRSGNQGYTGDIRFAGRYDYDEAFRIVEEANKFRLEKGLSPDETMMPE